MKYHSSSGLSFPGDGGMVTNVIDCSENRGWVLGKQRLSPVLENYIFSKFFLNSKGKLS